MGYEELKNIFETSHKLKFKLYSLEYMIEIINKKTVIYAVDYPTRKNVYNSFDELMNTYTVYNEELITLVNKISILD